jgi:hypothetical protein
MNLSSQGKMLLGSALIVFGIAVLADLSLVSAMVYFGIVFLSVLLFL